MPLIAAPPPPPDRDTISVRLDHDLCESLRLYAEFLVSTKDYVVQAALRRVCDRDKDFLAWRRTRDGHIADISTPLAPATPDLPVAETPVRTTRRRERTPSVIEETPRE